MQQFKFNADGHTPVRAGTSTLQSSFKPLQLGALTPLKSSPPVSQLPGAISSISRNIASPSPSLNSRSQKQPSRSGNFARKTSRANSARLDTPTQGTPPPQSDEADTTSISPEERSQILKHAQRFVPSKSRMLEKSRIRFENAIRKNTEEEEFAPRIYVINTVDNEPCPDLDFLFTNKLEYGTNVPTMSLSALQRCNCKGPCSPSGDCMCAAIQAAYSDCNAFSYDDDGRLKEFGVRTVECNEFCGCSFECPNKVSSIFAGSQHIPTSITFVRLF